ncbi:MAG: glutamate--tRNA ligase [Chloroflexi bacterium]|nr:MAG: glutamate--tRNA ligase [Chloroflexota bacterium]TMF23524.1 MAG: glutamate--tRNA ligase [Chloroflexota bacterium]TMG48539.1 MAG: glutamate--tRNA ligase [Chloroflexota bacterium]
MAGVDEAIRVRYAPSPTGALHLGGARTALFNYLFARQKHGQFLLRIEDTDRARFKPDSQASIEEGLHWLGMNWDEPAMIQSQRKEIYAEAASVLLELGAAYRCFCTPQRLEQMRAEQRARHEPERYDRRCRSIPRAESDRRAAGGERFVVRQAIPIDGTTTFHDLVMGTVTFRNDTLDDHVLLKSDGFPTYHLAFAVDDHAMAISHIIRGEGWLPSAPKHLLLFQAFNWLPPAFAHLPLVLGPDKKPLAKRHGAKDVLEYRDAGYLPEAVDNFIAFLGWSPGTTEDILTVEELISKFSIEKIQPSPAMANLERLDWLNGQFIRRLSTDELAARLASRMPGASPEALAPLVPLVRERLRTLNEAPEMLRFFFDEPDSYRPEQLTPKGRDATTAAAALNSAASTLSELPGWTPQTIEPALRALAERIGWSSKDLFMVLRVAITGRTVTPPLIESMSRLGKDRVLARLERAASALADPLRR